MRDLHDDERDERRMVPAPDTFDFEAQVASAEANADAAQLAESLSQIIGGQHQVMAGFRRFETLLAERARADSQQVAALSRLIVTPEDLSLASREGARLGVDSALHQAIQRITVAVQKVGAIEDRLITDTQERRGERALWVQATTLAALGAVIAMLTFGLVGMRIGDKAGEAHGYAKARDEAAAASWANTDTGKFARSLYQAGILENMRDCKSDGYTRRQDRKRVACFTKQGWYLP
jgi:hypothetical protein